MLNQPPIDRRSAARQIGLATVCSAFASTQRGFAAESIKRTGMGLVIYDASLRRRWMRLQNPEFDLFDPLAFLAHCHALGAGGMQANLGVMQSSDIRKLRDFASRHELFIDAIVSPPSDNVDISRFEKEIRTARDVGVQAARTTILPGRRYERFTTLDEFREHEKRGREMLERAAPVVEKHQVPLAVENHKDQRIEERIELLEHLDSEFIGACLDTGNSFALLDGAYEPIEALAPYALTVHLKDQALKPYEDGFLLGDIPLGQGSFDLKRIVATIRSSKPDVRFSLELITRDALKIPCLTDAFYATMPAARASDLARTMRFVNQHSDKDLQQVGTRSLDAQVQLEDANVTESIRYAREVLAL